MAAQAAVTSKQVSVMVKSAVSKTAITMMSMAISYVTAAALVMAMSIVPTVQYARMPMVHQAKS